jgi:hypothetical protein
MSFAAAQGVAMKMGWRSSGSCQKCWGRISDPPGGRAGTPAPQCGTGALARQIQCGTDVLARQIAENGLEISQTPGVRSPSRLF